MITLIKDQIINQRLNVLIAHIYAILIAHIYAICKTVYTVQLAGANDVEKSVSFCEIMLVNV